MPSGTPFSTLHATTQSMQPTHLRVSMTMAKRDMGLLLRLEGHEVDVHAGPTHERVDLVAGDELRIAGTPAERAAQHLRGVAEAVHHVDAVGADRLGRAHA